MKKLTEEQVKGHVESVAKNGYSVMENAIDQEFLLEICDELARLEEVRPGGDIPRDRLLALSRGAGSTS